MKKVTEEYMNEHIKRAANSIAPQKAEKIWEQPIEKAKGGEWYLDGTKPRKRGTGKIIALASSIAACLVVCLMSLYMVNIKVESTVYLDVNPSVVLSVNRNDKVLSAKANNSDGEIILEDMDLKNTDLDVAVNALLGSMIKHGYLSEAKDVILLSVGSEDAEKSEALRKQLADEINKCLTSLLGSCSVYDQAVDVNSCLEKLAEKYGISIGKASLLQRITDENRQLDYSELAKMSMNELTNYLAQKGVDLKSFANYTGTSTTVAPNTKSASPTYSEDDDDLDDDADDEAPDLNDDDDDVPESKATKPAYQETDELDYDDDNITSEADEQDDDADDENETDNDSDNDFDDDTDED